MFTYENNYIIVHYLYAAANIKVQNGKCIINDIFLMRKIIMN
jgi:hypothetical protein